MNVRHRTTLSRHNSPELRLIQRIRRQYLKVFAVTGAAVTTIYAVQRWLGDETGSALHLGLCALVYLSNFGLKPLGMSYLGRVNLLMVATFVVVFGDAYYLWTATPISLVSDAFLLNPHVEQAILVTRFGVTHRNFLTLAEDIYQNKKLPKLAILLNGVKTGRGYGHGSRYGYGYGYGYGYYEEEQPYRPWDQRLLPRRRK